jgi:hypothetical protein
VIDHSIEIVHHLSACTQLGALCCLGEKHSHVERLGEAGHGEPMTSLRRRILEPTDTPDECLDLLGGVLVLKALEVKAQTGR